MLRKLFSNKVKKLRKAEGISQEKFAEYIGLSMNSVNRIESGVSFPKPENIERICKYFNIDYSEMFTFETNTKQSQEVLNNLYRYLSTFTDDELAYILDCIKSFAKLKRKKK